LFDYKDAHAGIHVIAGLGYHI